MAVGLEKEARAAAEAAADEAAVAASATSVAASKARSLGVTPWAQSVALPHLLAAAVAWPQAEQQNSHLLEVPCWGDGFHKLVPGAELGAFPPSARARHAC